MNLIEVDQISKSFKPSFFRQQNILNNISFNLAENEFVVLRGKNGSGKTTLLNIILGLSQPNKGTVKLMGKNPIDYSSKIKVGVVLQKVSFPKDLKVIELIDLFRSYYPSALSSKEAIETVGLEGKEKSKTSQLSGGEAQRLYFALAIVGQPKLLILDEATRNLDEEGFKEFWKQITKCRDRNITILMVTNQQSDNPFLEKLATRYITLNEGKLEVTTS